MSDTAEYWWDIKNAWMKKKYKHVFTHKKGMECGHHHVMESKKLKHIDCHACIAILKEQLPDYEQIMNPPPPYGVCTCGYHRVKRMNKATKEEFLGCSAWPECKITSKINNNGTDK